jgi:NitT/TauT family transport system permease protein
MANGSLKQFGTSVGAARLASVALLLLVWSLVAALVDDRLCPSPFQVFAFIVKATASGELPYHLAVTLARVAAAFVAAMAVGSALGLAMGRSGTTNLVAEPWVILLLNAPALIIVVLAYIWIGLTETAAILAVALNKIPNVVVTVREGARAMDPAYMEMAKVYRFSKRSLLADVMLPQLYPYLAASARSGLSLIWKIVLVVELLGRSSGVGFEINIYFQTFDVRAILGYTVSFVAVMLAIEFLAVQPVERRAYRWRPRPA